MNFRSGIKLLMISGILLLSVFSCELLENDTVDFKESTKSIVGSWKIIKAYRNDVEITDKMDFSKFRSDFNEDESYTMANYLPFIVSKDGTYRLDDPEYPFHILFLQENQEEELETTFSYPIVNGERQIALTFSPGCISNKYTYVLIEDNPN